MNKHLVIATGMGLLCGFANVSAAQVRTVSAPVPAVAVATLADLFGDAVVEGRAEGLRRDRSGAQVERAVAEAVENVIVSSAGEPVNVLAALKLTVSREGCKRDDRDVWNLSGCAALAEIVSSVQASLGGPAATAGTGAVADAAAAPPPIGGGGSDYADD